MDAKQKRVVYISTAPTIIPRLQLQIETLLGEGYDVIFLGWDRRKAFPSRVDIGMKIVRVGPYAYRSRDCKSHDAQSNTTQWGVKQQRGVFTINAMPLLYATLYEKLKESRADIVHCTHAVLLPVAVVYARIHKARVVYEASDFYLSHSFDALPGWLQWVKPLAIHVEGLLVRKVDCIFCIPSKDRQLFKTYKRYNPNVWEVLNVPKREERLNVDLFEKLRRRHQERFVIVYAGAISVRKGIMKLVGAVHRLSTARPQIRLVLIGCAIGDDSGVIEQYIAKYCLHDFIELVPYQKYNDLYTYYRSATIGVGLLEDAYLGKFTLGGSRKVIEYMKAALVLLIVDKGEVGLIARKEKCGLLFNVDDPKDIESKIDWVVQNRGAAEQMRAAGKTAFIRKYHWGIERAKFLHAYREL